jgi:hypothetical protein
METKTKIGTLIFPTYEQANLYRRCTFTPVVANQHSIVKATIGKHPVGWVLQLRIKGRK